MNVHPWIRVVKLHQISIIRIGTLLEFTSAFGWHFESLLVFCGWVCLRNLCVRIHGIFRVLQTAFHLLHFITVTLHGNDWHLYPDINYFFAENWISLDPRLFENYRDLAEISLYIWKYYSFIYTYQPNIFIAWLILICYKSDCPVWFVLSTIVSSIFVILLL